MVREEQGTFHQPSLGITVRRLGHGTMHRPSTRQPDAPRSERLHRRRKKSIHFADVLPEGEPQTHPGETSPDPAGVVPLSSLLSIAP
jgi:hypothetical protein